MKADDLRDPMPPLRIGVLLSENGGLRGNVVLPESIITEYIRVNGRLYKRDESSSYNERGGKVSAWREAWVWEL